MFSFILGKFPLNHKGSGHLALGQTASRFVKWLCSHSTTSACNAGDPGLIPGLRKSPEEGNDHPLQPGEFHGQKSLAGYSPCSCKERTQLSE